MRDLSKDLENRKIIVKSLNDYGFILENNIYKYEKYIMNNEFKIIVIVENDKMFSKVIEVLFDDEYLMLDIETSTGEYVGKIRDEYNNIIKDIIDKCTYKDVYKSKQTIKIIDYVRKKYHDELEFLWDDENAIWLNKKRKKWYAVLMVLSENKINGNSTDKIEVINLRYQKNLINDLIDNRKFFPGFHMNKNNWITIKLDGSVAIKEIYELLDNSYNISLNK